jgi:capsular polysaccharide biosynthesis protein
VELEAESKAQRTWTPVLQGSSNPPVLQVPNEETVAIATFQWRRVPLTRPVIMRLLAIAAAIVIFCGVFAYALSARGAATYGSRSEVQYPITAAIASSDFLRSDRTLQTQLVAIKSRSVLEPVAKKYGLTVDELSDQVVASVLEDSEVIRIEVDDADQSKAQAMVGDITNEYLNYANSAVSKNSSVDEYWTKQLETLRASRTGLVNALNGATSGSAEQQQLQAQLDDVNNQIANAQTELSNARIDELQTEKVKQLTTPYDVGKVAPKPLRAGIAGALAGMMIAAGVVVLLIRRRLKQMPLDQFG